MKKIILFVTYCLGALQGISAQVPDGYYSSADDKCGQDLRSALESIIVSHTQRTYTDLWTDFVSTDARNDGKVWDMYSNSTNFTFGVDQAGSYKKEGDVYNREHSFPNSWFGGDKNSPMYTDLYHLYPTDGYVNNRRGNNPFGEVGKDTSYTSDNEFSKLGKGYGINYSGTVFEPADMYKGDFARSYFYMVTCYAARVSTWSSDMLSNGDLSSWAVNMLLRWSQDDPVSDKERNRIEAVYKIQGNRNPFIDCPGLEAYIWGNKKSTHVNIATLTGIISVPTAGNLRYHISPASGRLHVEIYNDHTPVVVYDIAGRTAVKAILNKGEYDFPLQKGMYVVGNQKVMVRY